MHFSRIRTDGYPSALIRLIEKKYVINNNDASPSFDGKMNGCGNSIFYVSRIGQLWRCIVLKYVYYPDSTSYFLVNTNSISEETKKFLNRRKNTNNKIQLITYDEGVLFNIGTKKDVISKSVSIFDSLLKDLCVEINNKYYVAFDKHNSFALYMETKGLKYCLIDTDGIAAKRSIGLQIYAGKNTAYNQLMIEKKTLSCECEQVSGIISCTKGHYDYSKSCEYLDINAEYNKLSSAYKNEIKEFFECESVVFHPNDCLLMTSSLWRGSYDESIIDYYRTYAAFTDYYLTNLNVIVKPHPAIGGKEWNIFFDTVLPGYIPSQFIFDNKDKLPRTIVYTSTTAGRMGVGEIDLTNKYLINYLINDKIYYLLQHVANDYNLEISYDHDKMPYIETCYTLIKRDNKKETVFLKIYNDNVYGLPKSLANQSSHEIIVDLNINNRCILYQYIDEYVDRLIVSRLIITNNRADGAPVHDGSILIFVKNKEIKDNLSRFSISKHMKRCNEDAYYSSYRIDNIESLKKERSLLIANGIIDKEGIPESRIDYCSNEVLSELYQTTRNKNSSKLLEDRM